MRRVRGVELIENHKKVVIDSILSSKDADK